MYVGGETFRNLNCEIFLHDVIDILENPKCKISRNSNFYLDGNLNSSLLSKTKFVQSNCEELNSLLTIETVTGFTVPNYFLDYFLLIFRNPQLIFLELLAMEVPSSIKHLPNINLSEDEYEQCFTKT